MATHQPGVNRANLERERSKLVRQIERQQAWVEETIERANANTDRMTIRLSQIDIQLERFNASE